MSPQTSTIIAVVISIFSATGFWSFLQFLIKKVSDKKSVQNKAILGLLHNEIYNLCEQYIARGYVSREEYENLLYLYRPYEELNGNGTARRLMSEVEQLPLSIEDTDRG